MRAGVCGAERQPVLKATSLRVFITGIKGQLGRALGQRATQAFAGAASGGDLPEFDITDYANVSAAVTAARPNVLLHCAAYTDVDGAARNPHLALTVNGHGTRNVARVCAELNIPMLYISSNEVFDGRAEQPYREYDATQPINPYGYSKLVGERYVSALLNRYYVVRTSWLTGAGGKNFVHRIQQLADERGLLKVVTDEVASPTFVADLVDAILKLIETDAYGVYHFANEGHCSRFDFARHILRLTGRGNVPVGPITLDEYPRPSRPPKFSPLANLCGAAIGIRLPPWEESLEAFLRS